MTFAQNFHLINNFKYMADFFEKPTKDTYREHWAHQSYHSNCSECYKENRLTQAHRIVNRKELNPWVEGSKYFNRPILPGDDE